jgi:hypothetical protein
VTRTGSRIEPGPAWLGPLRGSGWPNDVIGGRVRVLATALAAAILHDPAKAELKAAARA